MLDELKEVSRFEHEDGYVVTKQIGAGFEEENPFLYAWSLDGNYIGNPEDADYLVSKRGISPTIPNANASVCSIGFCEKEQKWCGWSHRAMYGFGIGSEVKRGDVAYCPADEKDFIEDCASIWSDGEYSKITASEKGVDEEGQDFIDISWEYEDGNTDRLLGARVFTPKEFGRGEWTAKTLDDAKQMAIDFAEGVS